MKNSLVVIVLFLLSESFVFANDQAIPVLDGVFKVENDQSAYKSERVASTEYRPQSSVYVVRGRVQYRDVEGVAYLEMWSILPDGSRYFSRTLGEYGTMQKIQGTSGWREFELPFNLMDSKPESVALEINVVMPGKGIVEVEGLTVSDLQISFTGEWFSGPTGGMIGGLMGAFWGIYGALVGTLYGLLAPRGKGRRFLTGLLVFAFIMGITHLVVGIAAVLLGQPYHVWYPFLLLGGLLTFVIPLGPFPAIKKAYDQAELRKLQALDA